MHRLLAVLLLCSGVTFGATAAAQATQPSHERVDPGLTARMKFAVPADGASAHLYGKVSHWQAGTSVVLEERRGDVWHRIATYPIRSSGRYVGTVVPRVRKPIYRVVKPRDEDVLADVARVTPPDLGGVHPLVLDGAATTLDARSVNWLVPLKLHLSHDTEVSLSLDASRGNDLTVYVYDAAGRRVHVSDDRIFALRAGAYFLDVSGYLSGTLRVRATTTRHVGVDRSTGIAEPRNVGVPYVVDVDADADSLVTAEPGPGSCFVARMLGPDWGRVERIASRDLWHAVAAGRYHLVMDGDCTTVHVNAAQEVSTTLNGPPVTAPPRNDWQSTAFTFRAAAGTAVTIGDRSPVGSWILLPEARDRALGTEVVDSLAQVQGDGRSTLLWMPRDPGTDPPSAQPCTAAIADAVLDGDSVTASSDGCRDRRGIIRFQAQAGDVIAQTRLHDTTAYVGRCRLFKEATAIASCDEPAPIGTAGEYEMIFSLGAAPTGLLHAELWRAPRERLALGAPPTTVTTTSPGRSGWFDIDASAGDVITFGVTGTELSDPGQSVTVSLRDPDGQQVGYLSAPSGGGSQPFTASKTGSYSAILRFPQGVSGSVSVRASAS